MDHTLSSTGIEDPLWAKIWSGNAGGGPRMRKTLSTDIEKHRYRENSGFKFCHTRRRIINFGKAKIPVPPLIWDLVLNTPIIAPPIATATEVV